MSTETGARQEMTEDEHRERHKLLHRMLDELLADFLGQTDRLLSNTSLQELMVWSHQQTIEPGDLRDRRHVSPQEASFQDAVSNAMRAMAVEHERYVRAWIAETGLHPSECELVQTVAADGVVVRMQVKAQPVQS
jgi:hypothetical protein